MVEEEEDLKSSGDMAEENEPKKGCSGALCTPINWFKMLCVEMHWSFVMGVLVVYGINQGLGGALYRVGTEYYMKDVQKVQPSEAQFYQGITSIPWLVKPLWGLLTDVLPIFGYRRRPYFIVAGKLKKLKLFLVLMFNAIYSINDNILSVKFEIVNASNFSFKCLYSNRCEYQFNFCVLLGKQNQNLPHGLIVS